MKRAIVDYRQDSEKQWVAELNCVRCKELALEVAKVVKAACIETLSRAAGTSPLPRFRISILAKFFD